MPELNSAPPDHAPGLRAGQPVCSAQEWFEVLYHELKRMARGEIFRHQALTIGPTTLLHEAWIRLAPSELAFASQGELIRYSARVMRGIVIDHIRQRNSLKRGGEVDFVPYETLADLRALGSSEALGLDDALAELAKADPALAELVDMKFFAGLSFVEIAALRKVSERTVQRDWDKARMLLFSAIRR
jgi:RNA polymerase sigma factor (TIGR02999 family)